MNNIEFTYQSYNDDELYRYELLLFLNTSEDNLFNKIDSLYNSLTFDLSPIYSILKKDKKMKMYSSDDYLFMFLFSFDYLYLFGPLIYAINYNLDYQQKYDNLIHKLNLI